MALLLNTEAREHAGSCNFCQSGRPGPQGAGLVFPYTHVALLSSDLTRGTGSMRLCSECLSELGRQLATLTFPEAGHGPDTART